MSKELYIAAHEALIDEYLDQHPEADEALAYDLTADSAYGRMTDHLADMADALRDARKYGDA